MKMNTKSRMAIAAILDVAVHGTYKPVALAGVAERQDISLSYLEQLFRKLREQGYVLSARGPGGGYRLNRRLADISVADIVSAVDREPLDGGTCMGAGSCQDGHGCKPHGLWCRVNRHLHDYLRTVTLDSILEETRNANAPGPMASSPATLSAAKLARMQAERSPGLM